MKKTKTKIETGTFTVTSDGTCKASRTSPDQKTIKAVLASAKKKPLKSDAIIIARYSWLKKRKLFVAEDIELPNLCLKIKEGRLVHVFYSNTLTHVIKKQRYHIQILN